MTETSYLENGAIRKDINAEDARTALVDALADLLHVLEAEAEEPEAPPERLAHRLINDEVATALESARTHYEAERTDADNTYEIAVR